MHSFFVHTIGVRSDSIDSVITDLVAMAHPGQDDPVRRKELLFSLSDFLKTRPRDCEKLRKLADKPMMPILWENDSVGHNLRSLNKSTWFLADRHDYHSVFKGATPPLAFAAFSVSECHGLTALAAAIVEIWLKCEHRLSHLIGEHKEIGTTNDCSIGDTEWLRAKVKYMRWYVQLIVAP